MPVRMKFPFCVVCTPCCCYFRSFVWSYNELCNSVGQEIDEDKAATAAEEKTSLSQFLRSCVVSGIIFILCSVFVTVQSIFLCIFIVRFITATTYPLAVAVSSVCRNCARKQKKKRTVESYMLVKAACRYPCWFERKTCMCVHVCVYVCVWVCMCEYVYVCVCDVFCFIESRSAAHNHR